MPVGQIRGEGAKNLPTKHPALYIRKSSNYTSPVSRKGRVRRVTETKRRECFRNKEMGTSLMVQWLRLPLLMQRLQVQSLVGQLRSHSPLG